MRKDPGAVLSVEIENEVHVRDDGRGEVEWPADDTNGVELVAVDGFGGFNGFDGVDSTVDGLVASMASMASNGDVDGFDGVEWWRRMVASNGGVEWWRRWLRWVASTMVTGVFDTEGTDVEDPLCPQW